MPGRSLVLPVLFVLAGLPAPGAWAGDSLFVHSEAGASSDLSNEQFYEDTYTDTTFLGRRLRGTPEMRSASVFAAEIGGSHGAGRWEYRLRPEAVLGDKVARGATAASLKFRPDDHWRLRMEQQVEYLRDRSYGLDRRESRAVVTGYARRAMDDDANALEFVAAGNFLRSTGSGDRYLLSHNAGRASFAWDHSPLFGWEWRLQYGADARAFPDSTNRDHVQQAIDVTVRRDLSGGHSLAWTADVERRQTMRPQASSRDRYVNARGEGELALRFGLANSARALLGVELFRYDQPDSSIDFDYEIAHAQLLVRRELGLAWSLSAGPRGEVLTTGWNEAEPYREISGTIEVERLTTGAWWLVGPSAGWRAYDETSGGTSFSSSALHSSYTFYELQLLADQALPASLRVRVLANGRIERHQDPSQDSRSLYFSLDLRRLF